MKSTIAVAGLIFLSTALSGQEAVSDFAGEAVFLSEAPVIDGHMNEKVWEEAALVTDFVQTQPDQGAPATQRTELRIGYDERNLYIGTRCYQSEPEKIVAVSMDRDRPLVNEDSVHIVLDTFLDLNNPAFFPKRGADLGSQRQAQHYL
ncbi:MAG: hypothetical protein GY856_42020 [bacterium]|nr:hypothetical protein [bacterium]